MTHEKPKTTNDESEAVEQTQKQTKTSRQTQKAHTASEAPEAEEAIPVQRQQGRVVQAVLPREATEEMHVRDLRGGVLLGSQPATTRESTQGVYDHQTSTPYYAM